MKPTRLQALGQFFPADQECTGPNCEAAFKPLIDEDGRSGGDFCVHEADADSFAGGRKRSELTWTTWKSPPPWSFSARVQCPPYIGDDEKTAHRDKFSLFQVHAAGDQANRGLHAALMLEHSKGRFTFSINYSTSEDADSTGLDLWSDRNDGEPHRWMVRFRYGDPGSLIAKMDGKIVIDYKGPLGFAPYPPGYFKAGIYRWPSGNPKPWGFSPIRARVDRIVVNA